MVRSLFGVTRRLSRAAPGWRASRGRYQLGARACAETQCRYHLAEFYLWEPIRTGCALTVQARGGLSQDDVGEILGVERQSVAQAEEAALVRLRLRMTRIGADTIDDDVVRVLRQGDARLMAIVRVLGRPKRDVHEAMDRLLRAGAVRIVARQFRLVRVDNDGSTAVGSAPCTSTSSAA